MAEAKHQLKKEGMGLFIAGTVVGFFTSHWPSASVEQRGLPGLAGASMSHPRVEYIAVPVDSRISDGGERRRLLVW